jgi:subtilisin family serine protease
MRIRGSNAIVAAAVAAVFGLAGSAQAATGCQSTTSSYASGGAARASIPNDPLFPKQWGLSQIKAPQAWSLNALGAGATIAIVDSGVDLNHPDLSANLVQGVDIVNPGSCSPGQDLNGHGTHVAGIAAATANNGIGVAGTAPLAKIMPVRVLDQNGSGSPSQVAAGIRAAADRGAQVINLSLGDDLSLGGLLSIPSPIDSGNVSDAVNYAYSHGAVVVAAAGNSSFPLCSYPAAVADAICVAANDSSGFPSSYSNFPLRLDGGVAVRAPGGSGTCGDGGIWSTYWPGATDAGSCGVAGYRPISGTSMAAAFVSGIAAMLRGAGASNAQVMSCLRRTSSNGGSYDPINGYGTVDAHAAVTGCVKLPIVLPQPPTTSSGQSSPPPPAPVSSPQPAPQQGQQGVMSDRTAKDTTAPRLRLTIPSDPKAHAARAGYVAVCVTLSEPAGVALKILNGRETAIAGRNAVVVARGTFRLRRGAATVRVPLTRTGRRVLRSHRRLTVTVLALARDAAGNSGSAIVEGKIRR